MTDSEQNMVNRLKMLVARMIIDLDDEKVLEIIKKAEKEADNNQQEDFPVERRDVPRGTFAPDIPLDNYIGMNVIVCLKDGEKLKGKLSCDSRYLKISDHITGEPFIFYGKDIETIDIMEES